MLKSLCASAYVRAHLALVALVYTVYVCGARVFNTIIPPVIVVRQQVFRYVNTTHLSLAQAADYWPVYKSVQVFCVCMRGTHTHRALPVNTSARASLVGRVQHCCTRTFNHVARGGAALCTTGCRENTISNRHYIVLCCTHWPIAAL